MVFGEHGDLHLLELFWHSQVFRSLSVFH